MQKTGIVQDIVSVLEYYRALGIERLPVSVDLPESPVMPAACALSGHTKEPGILQQPPKSPAGSVHSDEKSALLAELREQIGDCQRCKLSRNRTNIVFGEGNPDARMLFIGEGPGEDEDLQGRPFVGKAGVLLSRLIEKMELKRGDVYIGNIVKCRPPANREPEADEVTACRGFIERQIAIIRPSVIVTLGKVALQSLLNNTSLKITAARGKFLEYADIPVMPTFHPAYLLRNPADKWKTWADAQRALERMHHDSSH